MGADRGQLHPRTTLLADRGYDADWIRALASQQGAWANIPPKRDRKEPICFSPYLYRARNLVERFFNKLKQCRRVATRYDKLAANYLASIKLASIRPLGWCLGGAGFQVSCSTPQVVTMSPKSSVPQAARSNSWVLMADRRCGQDLGPVAAKRAAPLHHFQCGRCSLGNNRESLQNLRSNLGQSGLVTH